MLVRLVNDQILRPATSLFLFKSLYRNHYCLESTNQPFGSTLKATKPDHISAFARVLASLLCRIQPQPQRGEVCKANCFEKLSKTSKGHKNWKASNLWRIQDFETSSSSSFSLKKSSSVFTCSSLHLDLTIWRRLAESFTFLCLKT